MSSRKRAKMSHPRIAARFVTPVLLCLILPTCTSCLFILCSLRQPYSLSALRPSCSSLPFSPCYRGCPAHKKGKLLKDKMQSLYSQVSVYELPFAFRAHWDEWFLHGLSGCAAGKPGILACYLALNPNTGANAKCQNKD